MVADRLTRPDDAPRKLTLWAIGIATAVLFAGLAISFFTNGPGWSILSPRGATVASFSGTGDGTTNDFRVRQGWRIQWESSGDRFAMTILGDANIGTVVEVSAPDSGLTAPPTEGTFHIDVAASGAWTVTVLQGR